MVDNGTCSCNDPNVGPPCNRPCRIDDGDSTANAGQGGSGGGGDGDRDGSNTLAIVSIVLGTLVLGSAVVFFVKTKRQVRQAEVLMLGPEPQVVRNPGFAGPMDVDGFVFNAL